MNDTYLGNPNIKRDGVVTQFTALEVEEYKKCMNDAAYFSTKYCKIIHLDSYSGQQRCNCSRNVDAGYVDVGTLQSYSSIKSLVTHSLELGIHLSMLKHLWDSELNHI